MNIRRLNGNDLADLAANVLTLLAGTELSAIDGHVRADLVTAFGTLPVVDSLTENSGAMLKAILQIDR